MKGLGKQCLARWHSDACLWRKQGQLAES